MLTSPVHINTATAARVGSQSTHEQAYNKHLGHLEQSLSAIPSAGAGVQETIGRQPQGHSARWLNNLGNRLASRYERTRNMDDLEQAIEKIQQAVEKTPEAHPDLAKWLGNLGNCLARRYGRTENMDDLEQAIEKT
ncbi:MAG: hypothetical protein M1816_001678 [Peltula sp. TS41687]|nr:MAG: hypothetical protein M1816_001678 [Peltula sp. TS41687]